MGIHLLHVDHLLFYACPCSRSSPACRLNPKKNGSTCKFLQIIFIPTFRLLCACCRCYVSEGGMASIGTTLHIVHHERLPDGRLYIVGKGIRQSLLWQSLCKSQMTVALLVTSLGRISHAGRNSRDCGFPSCKFELELLQVWRSLRL